MRPPSTPNAPGKRRSARLPCGTATPPPRSQRGTLEQQAQQAGPASLLERTLRAELEGRSHLQALASLQRRAEALARPSGGANRGAPLAAVQAAAVAADRAMMGRGEGALLEGDDEEDEEPAVMMMDLALSADENKRDKKKGGDDKKEDCRDIKERKACRKSDSVCSWCENKYAPGAPMCADEATAKFLPPMVFECEASKRAPEGALLEEDDEFEALALPLESGEDGKGGGGFGPKANCRDLKERKACRKSEAVCTWCEGKFGGAPMCVDEDQAQYLPAMAFDCEPSKRPSANDFDTADEENKKGGHDKKEDCRDLKERKACRKSDSVCSWCVGKYGGQAMCADEAQAKYLPPMAFDCEPSKHAPDSALLEDDEDDEDDDDLEGRRHKRHSDDDKTEDCKDIKDRHACRKSKSVCNWCQGAFMPGAAMCMGEAESKWLPPYMYSCETSKRSSGGSGGGGAGPVPPIPGPPMPGPTDECSELTSAKKCGRASGCLWCEGMITAAQCFSEQRAALLPPFVYKCDRRGAFGAVLGGRRAGGGVALA
ncbi:hypothetical protein Rsub_01955 [Raphidocelis subcapitata]|uniref:Uncharacterized protein n=1 Tax=Raphidocelis subcapitata TaxID=307507 RepID=A0A2V0NV01_9CHLO|nr:hypothetical protein Rsub_01955 [Raphidocelis subcapitata]|eukprot:GBF89383.1 hypothetical protein Rsub_01955 [Raphidocelis subcapitata]